MKEAVTKKARTNDGEGEEDEKPKGRGEKAPKEKAPKSSIPNKVRKKCTTLENQCQQMAAQLEVAIEEANSKEGDNTVAVSLMKKATNQQAEMSLVASQLPLALGSNDVTKAERACAEATELHTKGKAIYALLKKALDTIADTEALQ